MELKEINIKNLEVDDYNARKGEWIHDDELVDSIKQMGVLEPLLVRKSKRGYNIICGSRRFNASIAADLKAVPCIIRNMTDLEALGTSLQENLQRGNLDSVQTAEAIADLWELMNGNKSYDEKIDIMNKQFGFAKTSVDRFLAISRLSDKIKKLLPHTGVDVAAGISTADWSEDEKEEAAEILSEVDSGEKRRKILSEMKREEELSPSEAYEKHKQIEKIRFYNWKPRYIWVNKAMERASRKWSLNYDGVIEKCVVERFRKEGWKK